MDINNLSLAKLPYAIPLLVSPRHSTRAKHNISAWLLEIVMPESAVPMTYATGLVSH